MDVVLVLLRLIHIVAAFVWFGVGFTQTFIISPAVAASGVNGMRFALKMNESRLAQMIFPAAAGITMLAGILLYIVGNATSHFSQTGNMVLGIGAVFGIIAGIHGGMFTGRASSALGEAISKYLTDDGISPEGAPVIREKAAFLATHARLGFWLMVVALIAMGSARYL